MAIGVWVWETGDAILFRRSRSLSPFHQDAMKIVRMLLAAVVLVAAAAGCDSHPTGPGPDQSTPVIGSGTGT